MWDTIWKQGPFQNHLVSNRQDSDQTTAYLVTQWNYRCSRRCIRHVKYSTVEKQHALDTGTENNIAEESINNYKTYLCRVRNVVPIWRWKIHLSHQNLIKKHFLVISTSTQWKPNKNKTKLTKKLFPEQVSIGFLKLLLTGDSLLCFWKLLILPKHASMGVSGEIMKQRAVGTFFLR